MAEKKLTKLPKYWYIDITNYECDSSEVVLLVKFMNSLVILNDEWDADDLSCFTGFDGNSGDDHGGFMTSDDFSDFINEPVEISFEDFKRLAKIKTLPSIKNVITKKALPSVELDGVMYNQPVGTVYGYNRKKKRFELISSDEDINNRVISITNVEANKSFYGRTSKKPTHQAFHIDGHRVEFKSGVVKVGCQTVPNEMIKAIAARLIK